LIRRSIIFASLLLISCTTQLSQRYIRNGARAEAAGHYKQAVKEYTRALSTKNNATLEMALYKLGFIYETHLKDYPKAINFYKQLIHRRPNTQRLFEAQKRIATIEMDFLGEYEKAVESWTALLSHFGKNPEVDFFQFQLAKAYLKAKKIEQARVEFTKLAKDYPQSKYRTRSELEFAKSFYVENDYQRAEEEIKTFLKNYPHEIEATEAKFYLAHVFEENDDLKGAVKIYQDLLHSYPDQNLIRFKLNRIEKRIQLRGR